MKAEAITQAPVVRPKRYIHKETRLTYEVTVVQDDPHERTHKARNEFSYWEGSEEQFNEQFVTL